MTTFTETFLDNYRFGKNWGKKNYSHKKTAYYLFEGESRPGFSVRITPKNKKVFVYRFKHKDTKNDYMYYSLGVFPYVTLASARSKYDDARKLLEDDNINPVEYYKEQALKTRAQYKKKQLLGTVKQLFDSYLDFLKAKNVRTFKATKNALYNHALKQLGEKTLANEVTIDEIKPILKKVYDSGAKVQSNRLYSYLHACFAYAIRNQNSVHLVDAKFDITYNPVTDIPKPYENEPVGERTLDKNELALFWQLLINGKLSMSDSMVDFFKLLILSSGQRVTSILEAPWKEINFSDRLWVMPAKRTKMKMDHQFPLSQSVFDLLTEMKNKSTSKFLFPSPSNRIKQDKPMTIDSVSRSCKRACDNPNNGINKFTPRDLRRTSKTLMGMAGISKEMRDMLQGHHHGDTSAVVYDKYDYLKELRRSVNIWEDYLVNVVKLEKIKSSNDSFTYSIRRKVNLNPLSNKNITF